MKGLSETPGLPRGPARLYLLCVLYLSCSCLLVGGLQENWITYTVTLKFCVAKAFPFAI